jgi:predicted AlkP superfamily phosphohydrolase/phosphomutase
MKMFVLGIDGGDENIFRSFDMPNYRRIAENNYDIRITEDLWSRGWAKMLTNSDVLGSGAVYEKPLADGSRRFTQRFSRDEIDGNPRITSLWRLLNDRGVSTGLMNIPGTFPAATVNGFFVSGAGAGVGKIDAITDELCSSQDVKDVLEKRRYIADTRLIASGVQDEEAFFERLEAMLRNRADVFIELARMHEIEFGMLAIMATSRVQYFAMHDIQRLVSTSLECDTRHQGLSSIQERIKRLYTILDETIGVLFKELSPEQFILTADHGAVPFRYTANANDFLARIGMLTRATNHPVWKRLIETSPTKLFPYYFIRVFAPWIVRDIFDPVIWSATKAFGHRYISGIYLNDDRFSGPVTNEEKTRLVEEIVSEFNAAPEAAEYGMVARPYRQRHRDSPFHHILPDVWLDIPDDIFCEGSGKFIEENPYYKPVTALAEIHKDMYSGLKGKHPLFITDAITNSLIRSSDPRDLTIVYRLVDRVFSSR